MVGCTNQSLSVKETQLDAFACDTASNSVQDRSRADHVGTTLGQRTKVFSRHNLLGGGFGGYISVGLHDQRTVVIKDKDRVVTGRNSGAVLGDKIAHRNRKAVAKSNQGIPVDTGNHL